MVIVDSDILIWLLRGDESVKTRFNELAGDLDGEMYITPIQIAELRAGMKDRERRKTEELLDAFPILEIDAALGVCAGDILRRHAPSHGVTLADALIAGTAMCQRMKLWTMNRKQYPGMKVDDFIA
jgi:predicted nucleic acid-binding protein